MVRIEHLKAYNFIDALRGMRNPKESWHISDSKEYLYINALQPYSTFDAKNHRVQFYIENHAACIEIGEKDLELAQTLIKAGNDHSKFMRQIFISMDITAPLYWWKEMDTYKVSTTANSCSTMHKLATTPITRDLFSFDGIDEKLLIEADYTIKNDINDTIAECEKLRLLYLETKNLKYWRYLIQKLPESWNQKRTWTGDYAIFRNQYLARENHKLTEWKEDYCPIIDKLPYGKELICI
jgi:hypothetical protein